MATVDKYELSYLGKRYTTTIRTELTDEQYREVVEGCYKKPSLEEVKSQML